MGAEESIKALFQKVLDEHNGNKLAAASSLETNHVTFWGWIQGKRGLNSALMKAIDRAGGQIVFSGQKPETSYPQGKLAPEIARLEAENASLRAQLADNKKIISLHEHIMEKERLKRMEEASIRPHMGTDRMMATDIPNNKKEVAPRRRASDMDK